MAEQNVSATNVPDRVECRPTKEPAIKMFLIAAVMISFGLWCVHDAFILHKYVGANHTFNVAMGLALPLLGLVALVYTVLMLTKVFVADQSGLGYKGRRPIPWRDVRKLVLRGKGLLDVHYDLGGQEEVFRLDSYKLQNFAELIALIETKTPDVPTESVKKK